MYSKVPYLWLWNIKQCMAKKIKAQDIGIFVFTFVLLVIFSQNIGLVFMIKIVSNMLTFNTQKIEITNCQMLKIVLFSLVFACFHLLQSLTFLFGLILKWLLAYLFSKMRQTK